MNSPFPISAPVATNPIAGPSLARGESLLRGESPATAADDKPKLRETFDQFVGEAFFSQLLSAMRKTVDKPAYLHGGRGEEVFQGQLDQLLADKMTQASAASFSGPMFELFMLRRL